MYKETLNRKPLRGFRAFLFIIILVFIILALMFLVGLVQTLWKISFIQYILLAGVLFALFLIFRRQITQYVYVISDNRIEICRRTGKKQRAVFELSIAEIEQFGKQNEVTPSGKKRRLFLFEYKEDDAFLIASSGVVAVLNPTETYMHKLKEVYEKTHC